jgi:hypothetical protein
MTASASPIASEGPADAEAPSRPRPWIAALLTLLLPGLGHVYAGRPGRAVAALLALYAGVVLLALLSFAAPFAALRIALLALMMLAPLVLLPLDAARATRRAAPGARRVFQRWYALLALWVVGAFAVQQPVFTAIKAHVAEAFVIPGGSMAPTVLAGDYLMTTPRLAHPAGRGDVVIYRVAGAGQRYRRDARLPAHGERPRARMAARRAGTRRGRRLRRRRLRLAARPAGRGRRHRRADVRDVGAARAARRRVLRAGRRSRQQSRQPPSRRSPAYGARGTAGLGVLLA